MTTAHRPTWEPAMATSSRTSAPTQQFSVRDLPAHTQLKTRKEGQDSASEVRRRDLREELEEREARHAKRRRDPHAIEDSRRSEKRLKYDESNVPSVLEIHESEKNLDADDSEDESDESDSSDSDDSEEEESDDEEELMKELEKIKKERLEEQQRQEMERLRQQEEEQSQSLLHTNPLIGEAEDFSVKKKWWEDTVFRNQAKEPTVDTKTFINDSTRNHFHRKFMEKYIK
eukprot:CAMPEP_0201498946 /NCGR_PEP_ID=MMETSP0151_2-20130828/73735_1 /ASSEMBLY_ACC=CAM_ASM_000257 /TAXON_ID=200890 /ORGANISM="Paramoeba atlantica, Strain 621/1 / CCAP 1560/9" /LENGTH=229 /DNA_ID=CAMNT_0047890889 /DNA_START=68 /DNA_END=757 /DNA_ORIENTATION=-